MTTIDVRRFDAPDGLEVFEGGSFARLSVGGRAVGRAIYAPGWRWSEHVGPKLGKGSCDVEHVGVVLRGRVAVRMDDGDERVFSAGDVFYVAPGHDSWVVGDEPYESLHLVGAEAYAAR